MSWVYLKSFIIIFALISSEVNYQLKAENVLRKLNFEKWQSRRSMYFNKNLKDDHAKQKTHFDVAEQQGASLDSANIFDERGHFKSVQKKTTCSKSLYRQKRDVFSEDPCYSHGLCANNENKRTAVCYCDAYCLFFGDCCYDADIDNLPKPQNLPNFEAFKCITLKTRFSKPEKFPFLGVTHCLKDYVNDTVRSQCGTGSTLLHYLPVWDERGIMYYNQFCAICNNVSKLYFARVNAIPNMCFNDNEPNTNVLFSKRCSPIIEPPIGHFYRVCIHQMKSKDEKCNIYQNPIQLKTKLYKNYFCVNTHLLIQSECTSNNEGQWFTLYPITVLFQFSLVKDKIIHCKEKEKMNSTKDTCMKTQCDSGKDPVDGLCPELSYKFTLEYHFTADSVVDERFFNRVTHFLNVSLQSPQYKFRIQSFTYQAYVGTELQNENVSCAEIDAHIEVSIAYDLLSYKEIEILMSNLSDISWTYVESEEGNEKALKMWKHHPIKRLCSKSHDPYLEITITETNDVRFHEQHTVSPRSSIDDFCLETEVETLLLKSQTLKILSWSCKQSNVTDITSYVPHTEAVTLQTILTYTCMTLSCITLAVSITIYQILQLSKTVPGSNTENLLITLLCAHALFMVGIGANDDQYVCRCLGIAIHYFWLSSFSFMTIAVINMTATFSKMVRKPNVPKDPNICLKRALTILGYTLPFTFVLPSVLMDSLNFNIFNVKYNGEICFLSGYPANLIFVSAPIILSIVINAICLGILISFICRQASHCSDIDKSYLSYIPVYARLLLLSGVIFVFGILSSITIDSIWQNVFIVLGSLHGFFVGIACCFTRRVYNLLRQKPRANTKCNVLQQQVNVLCVENQIKS